ncbi:MAG: hypothetical protein R3356_02040, partial [Eudoraea sp.]|nr:hypothetical protein [Eudoraea sp.]
AKIDEGNMELTGMPERSYVDYPDLGKTKRYNKDWEHSPLNDVHLYINKDVQITPGEPLSLPMASIENIGYSEKNRSRSAANALGIVVGTLALITIIVALTKSSCPFVYVNDGEQLVFQGELYPGNIIENAQKTDYIRLPAIKETDGLYMLEITNELLEIQHTDEAVLQVVDHPEDVLVMMDTEGQIHSIKDPVSPMSAIADNSFDATKALSENDQIVAAFDSPKSNTDGTRSIELWFDHQAENTNGKIILSLKNSYWLDYAMGSFYKQFGDYYPTFQKDQQKTTLEEAYQWRSDQSLPLSVYLETGGEWKLQHTINAVGPMHFRDIVLPLDLEEVGDSPVKIKLETGFMFWEVDKVAMDYTENVSMIKKDLVPYTAIDNHGVDAADLLGARDKAYLTQQEVGDWVQIEYQSPPMQHESRTVFLKNTGYYTYKREFTGSPDFEELKKFRNPGHFTQYAEEQYNAIIRAIIAAKPELVGNYGAD